MAAWRDVWGTFPQLRTERLLLRQLRPSDAAAYWRNLQTVPPEVWGGLERESVAAAKRAISFAVRHFQRHDQIWWAVCRKQTGTLMGLVKLCEFEYKSRAEVAYFLGRRFRGKGYMTEALTAVVAWAFKSLELHRIQAYARTDNRASRRLLEKAGFRQEGVLRQYRRHGGTKEANWRDAVWHDMVICAALRDDCGRVGS